MADLPTHKHACLIDRPNVCEICGTTETTRWVDKNGLKICGNCYCKPRNFIHGILNHESKTGIGVIAEYVVAKVLDDCENCNTQNNFCAPYDFISKKYGTINVKSSKLKSDNRWMFRKSENSQIPNYYICVAFNNDKSKIKYVFAILGNSHLVAKFGITITNSIKGLKRVIQYTLDIFDYNKVYQNLNIYSLSEFRNLNK